MTTPRSAVVYRGPSMLDGAPIIAIVTGLRGDSANVKTGAEAQLWILVDNGQTPADAARSGADHAICADCPMRPKTLGTLADRACYVDLIKAPRSALAAVWRGNTPTLSPDEAGRMLAGRMVRLGAYGEPTALPLDVVRALVAHARGWTGYTHQWPTVSPAWATLLMASVESTQGRDRAHELGYRTYRVGTANPDREISCPSARGVHCADCGACNGVPDPGRVPVSVMIPPHGAGTRRALEIVES